jgi:hypothetical protein
MTPIATLMLNYESLTPRQRGIILTLRQFLPSHEVNGCLSWDDVGPTPREVADAIEKAAEGEFEKGYDQAAKEIREAARRAVQSI